MKRWIGRWFMVVAIGHTIFGIFGFGVVHVADSLPGIISDGVINSIGEDPGRWGIFWFLFFGFLLFVLGLLIDWAEVNSKVALPSSLGWYLLVITILGTTMIPVSGFYLVLPPSVAIIKRPSFLQRK
ncbi:MAG: DUF6463 family protein [Fidelibacterota bacterium]